jgi:hypothetical protein
MSFRTVSNTLAFAPVRIGLAVTASAASLLGIFAAVRPDTVMGLMHSLMPL